MDKELLDFSSSDTSTELLLKHSSCCFLPTKSDFELNAENSLTRNFQCEGFSNLSHLFCPPSQPEPEEEVAASCPDPDSIKMFVGQIPHNLNDSDLLQMFEKYGRVFDLRVLRDKRTGRSKGCCFVTYYIRKSAIDAQNSLHNIKVLPGMHHAIQMKPADCENRNDRKLFIGMLPKAYSESNVRSLFSPFGTIEECTVLRDLSKESKGCAFVTYLTRFSAQNAVKSMHHCHVFEGCSSPIVVKFADNQKDKERRRLQLHDEFQGQFASFCEQLVSNSILQQQIHKNYYSYNESPDMSLLNIPMTLNNYSNAGSYDIQRLISPILLNQIIAADPTLLATNNMAPFNDTYHLNSLVDKNLPQLSQPADIIFQAPSNGVTINKIPNLSSTSSGNCSVNQKQIKGPDGANLFIYHLPREFRDENLFELFSPYGHVISAKVFLDKVTKLSKCFGFVSYDNIYCATAAIKKLNGYQIFGKKLKVEVKKKKTLPEEC